MLGNGSARPPHVLVRIGRPERGRVRDAEPLWHVAGQRIVCGRLVGDEVEVLAAPRKLGHDVRRVAEEPHRQPPAVVRRRADERDRLVDRLGRLVEIARLQPALDPRRIDLDAEDGPVEQRGRQRLRATHPAEAGRQHRAPAKVLLSEVLLGRGRERLVRPLEDSLRADVDPAACGHLAEHRQPERLQPAELVPRRPAGHEHRVRDQHARRLRVRPEDPDRLAALDEHRLVVARAAVACGRAPSGCRDRAPPCPSRRRRRATPDARRPRDRGC